MGDKVRKIIYFDKETIKNILQEQNKGSKLTQTGISTASEFSATIEAEAQTGVKLDVPFFLRLSFLFTGRIGAKFLIKRESETTITSTEISEFNTLKPSLVEMDNVKLNDIENSSTAFRVAGNYLRFMKGQVDEVDVKEFNAVMDGFEGYDAYKVDDKCYVRFNNSAFVSNYKRNDLLATKMTLHCIKVGTFTKDTFDFEAQLNKMQGMFRSVDARNTLADMYPPSELKRSVVVPIQTSENTESIDSIALYDVLYACVVDESNEK